MMKHFAKIQDEFVRRALSGQNQTLDKMRIDEGSTVKVDGIPFVLDEDAAALGREENANLVGRTRERSRQRGESSSGCFG